MKTTIMIKSADELTLSSFYSKLYYGKTDRYWEKRYLPKAHIWAAVFQNKWNDNFGPSKKDIYIGLG